MHGLTVRWSWRMRAGEWFEGQFTSSAADSPGSRIVGSAPVLIEPCQVVAVAEGGAGFAAAAAYR